VPFAMWVVIPGELTSSFFALSFLLPNIIVRN
jgi:hypothetical protein